jgi:hypothetical protein
MKFTPRFQSCSGVDDPANAKLFVLRILFCGGLLLFCQFIPASAQTTTITFDPPQFTAGQQLQTVGIVTFPDGPVVFVPSGATTFSPPNALRSSQTCASSACTSGAYMMRMFFSQLLNALSMKVGNFGTQTPPLCVPENTLCLVTARLEGFDVQGNVVADSGDIQVGDALHGSITNDVGITDASGRIAFAILFMNKGTAHSDYGDPVPAQIDNLTFTSTGVATQNSGTPPSITISAPSSGQSFSFPYQVSFSGNVSAPAGVRAFCTALNNTAAPPANQCNQVGLLNLAGNFSLAIQPQDLAPGTNTLSAFVYDLANQTAAASVTFSLQTPPAPSIVIFEPTDGQSIASMSNLLMTGGGSIPGGLLAFCTGANEATPPPPNQCNQTNIFFFHVPVPQAMLVPGSNTLDAFAYDRWGQLAQAHVNVVLPADPQIVAMEVTQGIQTTSIPINTPGTPVPYSGVNLYAGGKTIVRVFANTAAGNLPSPPIAILGTRDQFDTGVQNQLLGLIFPDGGPPTLTPGGFSVSLAQRGDPNGAFVFTLPSDWVTGVGGSITLYAVVNPDGFEVPPNPSCPGCQANSLMTLTSINFTPVSPITISPVAITFSDSSGTHPPNPDPNAVYAPIANLSPPGLGGFDIRPYNGMMDVSDLVFFANSQNLTRDQLGSLIANRVAEVEDIENPPGYTEGVMNGTPGTPTDVGLEYPQVFIIPPRIAGVAVADQNRPLTSIGHEFFHELRYYHAGTACNAAFPAVDWPPDGRGDIQGIGLDRSSETAGNYRILAPGAPEPGQLPEIEDIMSYCASESSAWISVRNWNAWGSLFPNGAIPACVTEGCAYVDSAPSPVGANQQTLRVTATIDQTGKASIVSVRPGSGKQVVTQHNPGDQLGYSFVIRDASGQVVSRTPVTPFNHEGSFLSAEVLSTNAAKVELERAGTVLAFRNRSPHAPTVNLLTPAANAVLPGNTSTLITWNAQDADGDPLSVRVEYSIDDGKNYKVLTAGVASNQVSLPGWLFGRSEHARIRLRVNDGFNETTVVSDRLKSAGSPPTVHILDPVAGTHFRNDVELTFVGRAYDDNGNPLPAESLKWFDGDRFLGQGTHFSAFDRTPGHRTIKLVARADDRETTATVDVIVDAVEPTFVGLRIPQSVDHGEDEMRITVGSSIPGVLVAGGQGYPVELKPRELRIPIPKSKEDLTLPLVLVAEGKTRTFIAHIKRN